MSSAAQDGDSLGAQPTAPTRRRGLWRRRVGGTLFWLLFVLGVLGLSSDESRTDRLSQLPGLVQLAVGPLMLGVLWALLGRFRAPIQRLLRATSAPGWLIFAACGLLIGIGLGANFAISFNINGDDINPNPLINTLLYVGIYGGVMLGWYLLRFRYRFDQRHVFWIGGSLFSLFEQGYIFPLTLISGNLIFALLLYPYLVVSYGVPFAVPFLMTPPELLPQGQRRFGWGAAILAVILSLAFFNLFGTLWFILVGALIPIGTPNI